MLFVTVSVIYRPIEQLLSRTIAERRARGREHDQPLRTPLLIQGDFALAFAIVALAVRGPIQDDLFDGSAALYWILFVAVLAYAASYFARGWLAGHQWFGLYGGLVFLEATSRLLFALAVAVGIAHGQTAVALGMAAAPCVSLVRRAARVLRQDRRRPGGRERPSGGLGMAAAGVRREVLLIMLSEQTLLNGAVITADLTAEDAAVAGFVFNVLLIARAPLQLFQADPGDAPPPPRRAAGDGGPGGSRAAPIRITVLAIAAFAVAVAIGLWRHRAVGDGRAVRRRRDLRPLGPGAWSRSRWGSTSPRGRSTSRRSRATWRAVPPGRGCSAPPRS